MRFEKSLNYAKAQDEADPLSAFRTEFHFPKKSDGTEALYFAGHSLGLQPKKAKEYVNTELENWAQYAVEGHFHGKYPWLPYHEFLTEMMAGIVGAKSTEVVMMNSLTVNLHLMMTSFYQPTNDRFKIIIEGGAFPSDQYAVQSQIKLHGLDPKSALIELEPRTGEFCLRPEDILEKIRSEGETLALVMLGNANYLTGQAFNMKAITEAAHKVGAFIGFDLAHGAGNLKMNLHDDGPNFAVWCSYKYLNSGPGGIGGCFVHERHSSFKGQRLQGWWGQNKNTRFKMGKQFDPIPGVEAWQLSNPPIFQLASARASLELFAQAGMEQLTVKGRKLSSYLEFLLDDLNFFQMVTPRDLSQRGNLTCVKVKSGAKDLMAKLVTLGVHCDFREPDILRFAAIPIYNNFTDVYRLWEVLKNAAQ